MRRPLRPDEVRLWRAVATTVQPFEGRVLPPEPPPPARPVVHPRPTPVPEIHRSAQPPQFRTPGAQHAIEPNRARRIMLGREPIGARLDLHGLDQDRARAALEAFIVQAQLRGCRTVLVITGQGRTGDGGRPPKRRRPCRVAAARPASRAPADAARRHPFGLGR